MKTQNKLFLSALALAVATPVMVQPIQASAETPTFKDLSKSHWAHDIIMEMHKENYINGYQDGTFKPEQTITRQHVAVLLTRLLPLEPINEKVDFSDVPSNHLYYDEITKVQQAGLFRGSQGKFNPDSPFTRLQMAQVLTLAFELAVKDEHDFPDVAKGTIASDQVSALYSNGITTGSEGLYKPSEPVTRAQYTVFLQRSLNMKKEPSVPVEPAPEEEVAPEDDSTSIVPVKVNEQVEAVMVKNKDLFSGGVKPFNDLTFHYNPIVANAMLNGMDAVRESGMKFYTGREEYEPEYDKYSADLRLKSEGYINPTERLGEMEFLYQGLGEFEGTFAYDFRSDRANGLAKSWLQLLYPAIGSELTTLIDAKVAEAREGARIQHETSVWWGGNGEFVYVGDYRIRLGVDGFLEYMAIEIEYKEWNDFQ